MTKMPLALLAFVLIVAGTPSTSMAAPCLIVTLTGTQSGPAVFHGQAGAGTLVRFGAVKLQFDVE
jgi:ribonuclease Z